VTASSSIRIDPVDVARRLERVRERIAEAGGDESIKIVAVTKSFGPDAVVAAHAVGLLDVGENYAQEMADKVGQLDAAVLAEVRWHFIGGLQSNKVRLIASSVHLWQTVEREKIGREIVKRQDGAEKPAALIQVKVGTAENKAGCAPGLVSDLIAALGSTGVAVRGLMTVGAAGDASATADAFATVRDLADEHELPIRSMGMSGDLELAVRAGSTMLRIGSDLFGSRQP